MTDIGFQLYSGRKYPLAEVLATIHGLGYTQAEGYGSLYAEPAALKTALAANDLTMPTAHVGLDELGDSDSTLRLAETLGVEVIICPWLAPEQRPRDAGGWAAFGERLQRLGKPYVAAGLGFGYHNHDFEFVPLPDGRLPMDVLLEAAPDIAVEVDVAWIARARADPAPWLAGNGARIVAVHIKDIAPAGQNTDEDGWADVGHGVLPWPALWQQVRTATAARYFIAEHDNPSDLGRFARRSLAAIRSYGA